MQVKLLVAVGAAFSCGSAAIAMTHPMTSAPGFTARASVADPDAKLERLAAAGTRGDQSRAKPSKSVRNVLKDDPYLRAAYASLDNK